MITNNGKSIIGKYLIGQAPAYASYIAIGCGPQPLSSLSPYGDYSSKDNLDFEMLRVPITSRGFVTEDDVTKIVLTAELPTEERYEISEVGLYSAGANPLAGAFDSKTVIAFTQGENWQYHDASTASTIPTYTEPLDDPNGDNIIAVVDPVFQTNADNAIFFNADRSGRYERCRFLNNVILIAGDDSDITVASSTGDDDGHFVIEPGSNHIHLTGVDVDFSRNSPIDELRLAFSIVSKDGDSTSVPDTVRILVEFASTDDSAGEWARFEAELNNGAGTGGGEYDFESNRYWVVSKQLQELYMTSGFTWNAVTVIKIYACAIESDIPTPDYYIALDAMRLENIATTSPVYGLTGYSVIKNSNATTVIKSPNTSNYIEFRFSIGVT